MTEITVSMPAYNSEEFIGTAIGSILKQDDIDFELIVVDDNSSDSTLSVVSSFNDPRIKLIKNNRRMGIGYCHNMVIEESNSNVISHIDSDDFIVQGSLRKMSDIINNSDNAHYAFCYFHKVDARGNFIYKDSIKHENHIRSNRKPGMDFRKCLLSRGMIANHFRTYKRDVFDKVGMFNCNIRFGSDYEMALRIADIYNLILVPEFLYYYRIHNNNSVQKMFLSNLRFWLQRWFMYRRLRNNGVSFLKSKQYNPYLHLLMRTYKIFGI